MPGTTTLWEIYLNNGEVVKCYDREFADLRALYGYVVVYIQLGHMLSVAHYLDQDIERIEKHIVELI